MIVISIDIGNTRTHLALINKKLSQCIDRIDILTKDIKNNLLSVIDKFLKLTTTKTFPVTVISSVQKTALDIATNLLQSRNISVRQFYYTPDLPLKVKYKDPSVLGTDRIANALYGCQNYPDKNLILISSGTALTVDLIVNTTFMGGAILPGLSMQFKSLYETTDALPEIDPVGECHQDLPPGQATGRDGGPRRQSGDPAC